MKWLIHGWDGMDGQLLHTLIWLVGVLVACLAWLRVIFSKASVENVGSTLYSVAIMFLSLRNSSALGSWYPNLQHQKDPEETLVDSNLGQSKCGPSLALKKKQLHQDQNNKAGGKNTGKNFRWLSGKKAMHCYSSFTGNRPQHPHPIPPVNSSSTWPTSLDSLASVPKLTPKYQQLSRQYYRRWPWNPIEKVPWHRWMM